MNPHLQSVSSPASPRDRGRALCLAVDAQVGVPGGNPDELPPEGLFRVWNHTHRTNIYREGSGGIAHMKHEDIRRPTLPSSDEGQASTATRHSLVTLVKQAFQVP